jgi:ribonuclease P protein component
VAKHGRSSVERNRLKRQLREIARTTILPGAPAIDVVVTTRPSAYGLAFAELAELGRRIRVEVERVAPRLLAAAPAPPVPPAPPASPAGEAG